MNGISKSTGLFFDNTRVSSYFECPRQYFFRHVMHLTFPGSSPALAFGSGWHGGLDEIWLHAKDPCDDGQLLKMAITNFGSKWVEAGFEITPDVNLDEKRNPGLALDMFAEYITKYRSFIKKYEVIAVEQPFVIPIIEANTMYDGQPPVFYIGRWDKVYRDNGRVYIREHKTTSLYRKVGNFAAEWTASFSPNNQVDGYSFAGVAVFGDEFKGVMVEGALVHKTVRAFTLLPITRSMVNLDAWVWEVRYWLNEILENTMMAEACGTEQEFLQAFPKRTEHCQYKYGLCPYLDLCKYGDANPLRMSTPDNFIESAWDPFDHNMTGAENPYIIGSGGSVHPTTGIPEEYDG